MLRSLNIRNLALVDDVKVGFGDGMNVITGETGAGKSLLIGALRLLLGERADKTLIRSGETSCSILAEFGLDDTGRVDAVLSDIGLDPCDGGLLIIRRVITESSGKILVNDEPVTLQVLKRLGNVLVDMHGPYDHQSLLDPATQLEILDAFGHVGEAKVLYRAEYEARCEILRKIKELDGENQETLEQQIEFLDYRVAEIKAAQLSIDEDEQITEEHAVMANAQQVTELANGTVNAMTEGEGCAFDALATAQRNLNQLMKVMPEAGEWHAELESVVSRVQELVRSIERAVSHIDGSAERMQWLDDRLTTYQTLKRKYGPTVEEVQSNCAAWDQRLEELKGRDETRAVLQVELEKRERSLEQAGLAIRKLRENVADHLSECITKELVDIGFEQGFFDVQLQSCAPGPEGMDYVEFGFAPNAGEQMRPLRMIASSGEISRVMLATKAVLARHDQVPVLVFDEIDANVGGEIGGSIGRKLAQVAECHQVICITHLPQVAACGTTHLAVSKSVQNGRTYTEVRMLDKEERPVEVARMLGGKDSTNVTLQHARELLNRSD